MKDSHWVTIAKLFLCRTSLGDILGRFPYVSRAYASYTYKRTDHGALFVGVFPTYSEALNHIPPMNTEFLGFSRESAEHLDIFY
ncbi:MAG: hypothetical protein ABI164_05705 [Acidobacteriaceae bacterium]